MEKLQHIYARCSAALDRIPRAKFVLKVTLLNLTMMMLSIPFFYPHKPWMWAAIILILILDGLGFIIPNSPDYRRSRR